MTVAAHRRRLASELFARRRPTAVVAVWLLELLLAWVLAAPFGELVAATFGKHPDGDRALWWEAGHAALVDLVYRHAPAIGALLRGTAIALAVWALLSAFPLGSLLAALSDEPPTSLKRAAARGGETFGRLLVVQLLGGLLLAAVALVIGVIPSSMISGRAEHWNDPRIAMLVSLLPLVVAGVIAAWVLATLDLARALVVRHGTTAMRGLLGALQAPRAALALLAVSVPRWVASLGLLGFAAAISGASGSIALVAAAHQLSSLGRVGLRASVLARALRASDVAAAAAAAGEAEA